MHCFFAGFYKTSQKRGFCSEGKNDCSVVQKKFTLFGKRKLSKIKKISIKKYQIIHFFIIKNLKSYSVESGLQKFRFRTPQYGTEEHF